MHRETPAQFVGVSDSDIDVMSEIDINLTFDSLVSHPAGRIGRELLLGVAALRPVVSACSFTAPLQQLY